MDNAPRLAWPWVTKEIFFANAYFVVILQTVFVDKEAILGCLSQASIFRDYPKECPLVVPL